MTLVPIVRRATLMGPALFALAFFAPGEQKPAPPEYGVERVQGSATGLLDAEDAEWRRAERIEWGPQGYTTAFRALWSGTALLVRFDATDPDPWYTKTRRDDRLWEEEVVEVFLEPGEPRGQYVEIEINPGNVVCDLRLDFLKQTSDLAWDLAGLESRVRIRRDAAGHTTGWTAVAVLPWEGLRSATAATLPPRPGDQWHFNVFRIKRPGGKQDPERGALYLAWSPTGKRSFHVLEAFRGLRFRAAAAERGGGDERVRPLRAKPS
jgi:hypothetical protein